MNTITFKYKHQHTDEIWNVVIDKDTLVKDWQNDAEYCPPNDTKLISVTADGKELIGNKLPKKTDFEHFIEYLISSNKKKLTITELKNVFKKNKWKFIKKEKVDFKKIKSTEQFVFEKKIRTKQATVWLSFNSLNDVKEYYYDIELSNSKTNYYNSYGNVGDIYASVQDVVKVLNEDFEEFE